MGRCLAPPGEPRGDGAEETRRACPRCFREGRAAAGRAHGGIRRGRCAARGALPEGQLPGGAGPGIPPLPVPRGPCPGRWARLARCPGSAGRAGGARVPLRFPEQRPGENPGPARGLVSWAGGRAAAVCRLIILI